MHGRAISTAKMTRDVLGTFYNYSLEIDRSFMTEEEYTTLYDILSAPVDSHQIVVPYNDTLLTFEAYVTNGSDKLKYIDEHGVQHWEGLSCNFIAMSPERTPNGN